MKWNNLILVIFTFFVLFSCGSKTEKYDLGDFGYDYYPVQTGSYWIYKVDSFAYKNLGESIDSSTSYIREEIVESFVDQIGDTIHRIERKYSNSLDSDQWIVTDEWATHTSAIKMTRTEENLKYIKMVFPLKDGLSWDGNAFVDKKTTINIFGETLDLFIDWEYRVLSVDQKETILDIEYDHVVTIQNADNNSEDLLHRRYVIEKYAKNVGLVYKKNMILDTQCIEACDGQTWEEKAEKGYIMEMNLIEYGK